MTNKTSPKKPAEVIRLGRIRAAIWANQTEGQDVWFNVTVSRLYKDQDRWKDTSTFRRDDLPIVCRVLELAYAKIWEQSMASTSVDDEEVHY